MDISWVFFFFFFLVDEIWTQNPNLKKKRKKRRDFNQWLQLTKTQDNEKLLINYMTSILSYEMSFISSHIQNKLIPF